MFHQCAPTGSGITTGAGCGPSAVFHAFQAMMTSLGISEGDRRRMGLELTRTKPEGGQDAAAQARSDAEMMAAWASGDPAAVQAASGE